VSECALKAYLSRDGNDQRLRRKDLRHNLDALWQLAHAEGLAVAQNPPAWLQTLSGLHDDPYFIRYSKDVHALVMPAPQPMAAELAAMVELVGKSL